MTAQSEAKVAVNDFSGKSCGIVLSGDETKVRSEFQVALELLQKDTNAVQDKLTNARKLTAEAVSSVMSTSKREVSN